MRLRAPRSLFARLFGLSALSLIAALAFAALSIGHVLERFVLQGMDERLDAQVGAIARALRPDGTLDEARIAGLPAFDDPGSGWGWQVDGPGVRHLGHGATIDAAATPPPPARRLPGPHPDRDDDAPRPGDARSATGERLHFRQLGVVTAAGPVLVTASGPRRIALAPLREAMMPLLGSLALLAAGLVLAGVVQLRFGLQPLRALRAALADVRAGRRRHVPEDQPDELAPLARELNALLDQNEAGLDRARRHVANLAHGLKTPLAALALKLGEEGRDPDGTLGELVARADRHIRHHLGRARAAGGGARLRTPLAEVAADLVRVLRHVHAARGVEATLAIAPGIAVTVDRQDLDEMLGNLLDNAWRHAATTVAIAAVRMDRQVALTLDDDGPGVPEADVARVLRPGHRLDEGGDGHGFGLAIVQELVELNGGTLALLPSPTLGGLRVRLLLPDGA